MPTAQPTRQQGAQPSRPPIAQQAGQQGGQPVTPESLKRQMEVAKGLALRKQKSALYEVTQAAIRTVGGYDIRIDSDESMRKAINGLASSQRKQVREIVNAHMKDVNLACAEAMKGKFAGLIKLPAKLIGTITKGAAIGTSVAGIINSVFPGLFNTLCGYIAGASPEIWKKLVGLGIGMVTNQAIAGQVMLGAGAALGAVVYAVGKAGISIIKGIRSSHQKHKQNNGVDMTR